MRKLILSIVAASLTIGAFAQVSKTDDVKKSLQHESKDTVAWQRSGLLNVGINQGFLHNWAAGGDIASLTVNGLFTGNVTRLYHRQVWANNLDMTYSLFYSYANNFVPRKIDDRIDFTSKYGVRINPKKDFFISALLNFKTQFSKGYDYKAANWDSFSTSKFMSPGYLTLAIGGEYRKGSNLSLFFSPIAARATFVDAYYTTMAPDGAFGVENGKTFRFELGAYFTGRYMTDISKTLSFKTRVDLFTNYLAKNTYSATGGLVKKDNPGNIDWLWDNLLMYKASKYISLSLGLTLMYDNDIPYVNTYLDKTTNTVVNKNEPGEGLGWVQLKQIFTLGFVYKF